jgi:hypothetical protein
MSTKLVLNKNYTIQLADGSLHEIRILEFNETCATCFFVREWIACVKVLSFLSFNACST